jgi:predicted lipid-binding transport protein (Tim44 family)
MEFITLLIAAGAAVFFGYRLFMVLGRKTGHTPDVGADRRPADDTPPAGIPATELGGTEDRVNWVIDMDPALFMDGARKAYALIVEGFAKGDRKSLEPLLTGKVYARYEKAITDREGRSETTTTEIERIAETEILDSEQDGSKLQVRVRFKADISTETKDKDGHHVSGDLTRLNTVEEIWTFEKNASDRNSNWKLAAVKTA